MDGDVGGEIDQGDVTDVIRAVVPDAAALRTRRRSDGAGQLALGRKLAALLDAALPDAVAGPDGRTMTGDDSLDPQDAAAALQELAEHLCATVPAARPSPAETRARLGAIAFGLGLSVPWPERVPRSRGRGPLVAGTTLLVVALTVAAAVALRLRPDGPADPVDPDLLYANDFVGDRDWRTGAGPAGNERYSGGGYELRTTRPGFAEWVTSPVPAALGVRVSARARLLPGQGDGGWGVWCRGSDAGERYEFSLTTEGYAYVAIQGEQPELVTPAGLDPYSVNEIAADCGSRPDGGTALRMTVNGALVADRALPGPTLPAGSTGVHGFAYGNVAEADVPVLFSSFSVRRTG